LKEEALDRSMWRNRFGRGFGPVVSQITDDDDDSQSNRQNEVQKSTVLGGHPFYLRLTLDCQLKD
jgi:hypothetical protein